MWRTTAGHGDPSVPESLPAGLTLLSGALGTRPRSSEALLVGSLPSPIDHLFRPLRCVSTVWLGLCAFGSLPFRQQLSYDRMNLRDRDRFESNIRVEVAYLAHGRVVDVGLARDDSDRRVRMRLAKAVQEGEPFTNGITRSSRIASGSIASTTRSAASAFSTVRVS
jgi:hypothetical protein